MFRKFVIILFLFCVLGAFCRESYGLTFLSHSVNQDERTSLDLGGGHISFPQPVVIEFDLKLNNAPLTYGYVFRLVSSDTMTLDFISNANAGKLQFVLIQNKIVLSNTEYELSEQSKYDWKRIKIKIQENNITYSVSGEEKTIPYSLCNFKQLNFFWGKNRHALYHTTDVPPITVKNVCIKDEKGVVLYAWDMLGHGDGKVYDKVQNVVAVVENGVWEIDRQKYWHKEVTFRFNDRKPQLAYDSVNARIFIDAGDTMIIYQPERQRSSCLKVGRPFPHSTGGENLIYNSVRNELLLYSYENKRIARFDINQGVWIDKHDTMGGIPLIQQHNRFVDLQANQLVLYGGYGNHVYNSELIICDLAHPEKWHSMDLSSQISPRYLSALGYVGDGTFYVMGGYGSASGKQEEAPTNYCDLFKVKKNHDSIVCEQVGMLESKILESRVFSNSMVVDTTRQVLYALAYYNDRYESSIQLVSYNWRNGQFSFLSDVIPYNFLDVDSYCDLFLHKGNVLYAIVLYKEHLTRYVLDVYSLVFPPLKAEKYVQNKRSIMSELSMLYFFIVIVLVFGGGAFFLLDYYKKKHIMLLDNKTAVPPKQHVARFDKRAVSVIRLLGGFQVFSREGKDITEKFTPTLKQLFLFILLNFAKNGKKVTSERLDDTFWSGMDKGCAANNRNVNISKLRLLLKEVGDVCVVNKNGYWTISLGDNVYFDYGLVMNLLSGLKDGKGDKRMLEEMLTVAQEGRLLPNVISEWIDDYKSDYTDTIIDFLSKTIMDVEYGNDPGLRLRMANVLLLHDCLDEAAVRIKCKILSECGQKGAAKQCYDKFYSDYQQLLNEKPNFTYEDIFRKI